MADEQTVGAASSAAEEQKVTQFDSWDEDGNPVATKKQNSPTPAVADSASADAQKDAKSDDAADSAAKKQQEKTRKPDVEARFKKLTDDHKDEVARLQRELDEARKPKETQADSSPARQAGKDSAEPQPTRPRPTLEDKGPDGKPKYPKYEDYIEGLSDWKFEQALAKQQMEERTAQQRQTMGKQLEEARGRYMDFDSVTKPLVQDLMKPEMSREVLAVVSDSPVLADLLYTIGGSEASKADFLEACRVNPGKALRVALLMEQEIVKELGKGKAADRKSGEAEPAPVNLKPRAPKPPAEVGGRGTPGEDVLQSAAKAGNFRAFEAEQTRRALAARR